MTGRGTMLNISRWTLKEGSYRAIQRFYNTILSWYMIVGSFNNYLFNPESDYHRRRNHHIKIGTRDLWFRSFLFLIVWESDPGFIGAIHPTQPELNPR